MPPKNAIAARHCQPTALDPAGRNPYPPACHATSDCANCRRDLEHPGPASPPYAAGQAPPANPPDQGILVLRNGQTIEGRITQADGLYVVDLGDGQIRVKPPDVDLVCACLEDGYQRKRAAIQVGNVQDHIELAQWCLRHGLLGPAATELADATVAEPNNPMIDVLTTG